MGEWGEFKFHPFVQPIVCHPRQRIYIDMYYVVVTPRALDERRRFELAGEWEDKPSSFWTEEVTYIDTKRFVQPQTKAQRRRMRQSKVRHHLRTASERNESTYVVPKKARLLTGIPSVEITAAVHKNRIIMWRESEASWSGAEAAAMYADLGKNLRRVLGDRRSYRVVEDGDPKGFQSNKGKAAKTAARITSWKLPPRSPDWMPLDYSLWAIIEDKVLASGPEGHESKQQYRTRLRTTALGLPRKMVAGAIKQMKGRIKKTKANKGKYIMGTD